MDNKVNSPSHFLSELRAIYVSRINPTAQLPIYKIRIPGLPTRHLQALDRDTQLRLKVSNMTAQSAPWFSLNRGYFSAKAPGHVTGWLRKLTLTYFISWPFACIERTSCA
jgi:hypothetical protein